jgi:hypothetical protein
MTDKPKPKYPPLPKEEFLPINNHPLNQLAKKALLKVDADFQVHKIYWPQLGLWALDSEGGGLKVEPGIPLQRNLEVILDWEDPKDQMVMLLGKPPDSNPEFILKEAQGKDPLELAELFLDCLDNNLTEFLPNYRPAPLANFQ